MEFAIYAKVFLGLSILFVPPLGYMVQYVVVQDIKIQSGLQTVKFVEHCIDCCVSKNATGCEGCSDRLNCIDPTQSPQKYVLKKDLIQVVEKVIKKTEEKLVEEDLMQFATVGNFEDVYSQVVAPKLPQAHVHAVGQPINGSARRRMLNWEWRIGAERTMATFPHMFDRKNGAIVVPLGGTYKVYVHTTFVTNKEEEDANVRCQLGHEVRDNLNDFLIKSEETQRCDVSVNFTRDRTNPDLVGFHTMHSEGTFQLEKGKSLKVFYIMPDYVQIGTLHTETYFGIFMV